MTPIQQLIYNARYVSGYLTRGGDFDPHEIKTLQEMLDSAADAAARQLQTHLIDAIQTGPQTFVELWYCEGSGIIKHLSSGTAMPLAISSESQYSSFAEAKRIFNEIKQRTQL